MADSPQEGSSDVDSNVEGIDAIASSGVNRPAISKKTLKPTVSAIRDGAQAHSIFEAFRVANNQRNSINAKIAERYLGTQPRPQAELVAEGNGWQSNISILFLAGIIDKVVPVLTAYIENSKSLTQAKLKSDEEEAVQKSEQFREKFTSYVRRWTGWRSFCSSLCQEIVLMGYTSTVWLDEYTWKPLLARQDECFFPEGTPQFAEYVQAFAFKQDLLIHEMTETIQDREAAEAAKWDVDNVVEALNNAMPASDKTSGTQEENARSYVDMIREGNLGSSYSTGARVVKLGHTLAIETGENGQVTHYIVDRNSPNKTLLAHEKRYDKMTDVICLFTLEPGNGKYYGSKGMGRMLVNFSVAMDQVANDAINALKLAGLIILKQDLNKGAPPPKIKSPFMWVNQDAEWDQKSGFQENVQAFVTLYEKLTEIAQVAAQQYIPHNESDGTDKTAREVSVDYTREQQSRAAFIARFAGQFAGMISTMQRRMCNPDTNDKEALEFQKELKEDLKLTQDEIKELANSVASEVLQDLTQAENEAKASVVAAAIEDPQSQAFYDQKKIRQIGITARVGGNPQFAKDIMLQDAVDPTIESEGVRQQIMENEAILQGASIPVSPRDADEVHLKALIPELTKGIQSAAQSPQQIMQHPERLDDFNAAIVHAEAHVKSWAQKGGTPEQIGPFESALKQLEDGLTHIATEMKAQSEQMQQQAAQQQAEAPPQEQAPPTDPNAPVPMTEGILKSWIAQYPNLPGVERGRLEAIGGLGPKLGEQELPDGPPLSQQKQETINVEKNGQETSTQVENTPPVQTTPNLAPSPDDLAPIPDPQSTPSAVDTPTTVSP